MFPATPPASDLTRPGLRQVAAWIRDELDPVIAREGPEVLKADHALTLHEVFNSLRASQTITALDLRATGIHRAVLEVAGTATRWPGRLVDDCDRIIHVWTSKFGPLEDLRPFMYGRVGRLEGIASATEFSKASLIERWQRTCPEKIAPSRSHRSGNLGFRAGAWWLNALFAHHAGIIDLDTTDGGICHDKYGAYAVLLKDTGEIEAISESTITYRCSQDDKGRFRLTSAIPKSRLPIRILRSHSLNSMWGPKAGVRYEGLYRVSGWTIRHVRTSDFGGTAHKVGDIMYEVKFERDDPVSMEEVMKHPTTFELDDYAEYKRLRRVHREGPSKAAAKLNVHVPAKAAPPIPPLAAPVSQLRAMSQFKVSPTSSRSATFKHRDPMDAIPSSRSTSTRSVIVPEVEWSFQLLKGNLEAPTATSMRTDTSMRTGTSIYHTKNGSPKSEMSLKSNVSDNRSQLSNPEEIREVAPWIDFDPELAAASYPIAPLPRASIQHDYIRAPSRAVSALRSVATSKDPSLSHSGNSPHHSDRGKSPSPGKSSPGRSPGRSSPSKSSPSKFSPAKSTTVKSGQNSCESKGPSLSQKQDKDARKIPTPPPVKLPFVRSRNPLSKLFDGTEEEDYFSYSNSNSRAASKSPKTTARRVQRQVRSSSIDATVRPLSPIPIRPMSAHSSLITQRRDAICFPYEFGFVPKNSSLKFERPSSSSRSSASSSDPFVETPGLGFSQLQKTSSHRSLPVSLKDFISKPKTAMPVSVSSASLHVPSPNSSRSGSGDEGLKSMGEEEGSTSKEQLTSMLVFKDPFKETRSKNEEGGTRRCKSAGVETLPPDAIA